MEYFKFNKIHKLVKVIDKNGNKYRITFLYLKQWPNVEIKQGNRYVRIEDYYHKLNNYQPSKNIPEFSSFAIFSASLFVSFPGSMETKSFDN